MMAQPSEAGPMGNWKMYRHKKGVALYHDQIRAEKYGWEPERKEVRYAVWCDEEGNPIEFTGERLIPHSGTDKEKRLFAILCPRNVRFAPEGEDLDVKQWATSTLPVDQFNNFYEPVSSASSSSAS